MHIHNCRCFSEHLRMLLQSLRALCKAPGGPGSISKYLEVLVRATGVSERLACGFRMELDFADACWESCWTRWDAPCAAQVQEFCHVCQHNAPSLHKLPGSHFVFHTHNCWITFCRALAGVGPTSNGCDQNAGWSLWCIVSSVGPAPLSHIWLGSRHWRKYT